VTILAGVALLVPLSLGVWFRRAASSFRQIVQTSGRDVDNLMAALEDLRKSFSLLRAIIVIYAALIVIGLVAVIIAALLRSTPA
jgi:hypothetical protein